MYLFNDYWEDIGIMKSFFEVNLVLVKDLLNFEFYNVEASIYISSRFLSSVKIEWCYVKDFIIFYGVVFVDCFVEEFIVGLCLCVEVGMKIKRIMIIGVDFYESEEKRKVILVVGGVLVGIGENIIIENVIIDKNVCVGKNCVIINKDNIEDLVDEERGVFIRNGIVIIFRNCIIFDGMVI